jgi:hypothetical protein
MRKSERIDHLIYVGAVVPAPDHSGSRAQNGVDWPSGQAFTIEERIAKAIFGDI